MILDPTVGYTTQEPQDSERTVWIKASGVTEMARPPEVTCLGTGRDVIHLAEEGQTGSLGEHSNHVKANPVTVITCFRGLPLPHIMSSPSPTHYTTGSRGLEIPLMKRNEA